MNNIFGRRLRKLRRDKDISMEQLAEEINTTQATLSRYENGKRIPDIDFLETLAKYFGVTSDYLLGQDDIKNKSTHSDTDKADRFIIQVREEVAKHGYDLSDKSKEEIAKLIVKALKIDEITKSN